MSAIFIIPFPPAELSPNKRLHWSKVAKVKKQYRADCCNLAKVQGAIKRPADDVLAVHLVYRPPDKRRRDWDNMLAATKSGLDGLADALGVDDSRWRLSFEVSSQIEAGGRVEVTVFPLV